MTKKKRLIIMKRIPRTNQASRNDAIGVVLSFLVGLSWLLFLSSF